MTTVHRPEYVPKVTFDGVELEAIQRTISDAVKELGVRLTGVDLDAKIVHFKRSSPDPAENVPAKELGTEIFKTLFLLSRSDAVMEQFVSGVESITIS